MGYKITVETGEVYELVGDPKKRIKEGGALLGQGGQGAAYKIKDVKTGKFYALKKYWNPMSSAFIDNLRKNIQKGTPNDSFLWPLKLTKPMGKNLDKYGYVMDLYDAKSNVEFVQIVKGRVSFPSKEMQITMLVDLVDAFEALHARGYSYQDLNDGGILFNITEGKVLICDNDNVAPYGVNLGIQGKFKYMAPEVAINMFLPDTHSDRYSLAVIMFMILCHAHPLDGALLETAAYTDKLQHKVYGSEPVFVYDPNNTSNRPRPAKDKNVIKFWPLLPPFIQDLFIRTFTKGMPHLGERRTELEAERQQRTTEREWKAALYRWLDSMATCPHCQSAVYPEIVDNKIQPVVCPHCKKKVQIQLPLLVISKNGKPTRSIILDDGKQIAKSCVTIQNSNEPAFTIVRSKKNAKLFGIKNLLTEQILCTQPGTSGKRVNTGEVCPALNDVHLEIDNYFSGDIYYN